MLATKSSACAPCTAFTRNHCRNRQVGWPRVGKACRLYDPKKQETPHADRTDR